MSSETVRIFKHEIPKPLMYAYVLSILYNIAFFLQFTAIPHLSKHLELSDKDFGYVQTIFGVFQMVGGPLYGYVIQKLGIRRSLFVCYLSTMISGILLYFSTGFYSLLLSRVPCLFMHGQQAHQTLISALTNPGKERTSAFGRMGLTFGIGFIFLPIFSISSNKLIGKFGPFVVSSILSIVPCIVLERCINRALYEYKKCDVDEKNKLNITNVARIIQKPGVLNILVKKNGPIIPFLLIIAVLNLYIIENFNATNTEDQIMQMMIGIFIMFSNGFGVIHLRSKFGEQKLLIVGCIFFIIGYFLFTTIFFNFWMLVFIMPFVSLGMSVVATCSDSLLTALVDESEQGIVLGTATSFNSLVRTFSPLIAGYMLQNYGFQSLTVLGMIGSAFSMIFMIRSPVDDKLIRKNKHD